MRIHSLRHVSFETPGIILDWANGHGYTVTDTPLYAGVPLPDIDTFDWLIVMGGPMNIYEEYKYPWLAAEKAFIKASVNAGKTVIGLCLGAQLLADVIGGKVTKNRCAEIGWLRLRLTDAAAADPALSFMPHEPTVFQWHGDTFSSLPENAVILAESDGCANQAFRYGERVYGFQFHLENTAEIIGALIENCGDELVPGMYVQSAEEILSHCEYIAQDNALMKRFLDNLTEQVTQV